MKDKFKIQICNNIQQMKKLPFKDLKNGQYFLILYDEDKYMLSKKLKDKSFIVFNIFTQDIERRTIYFESCKVIIPEEVSISQLKLLDIDNYLIINNCAYDLNSSESHFIENVRIFEFIVK